MWGETCSGQLPWEAAGAVPVQAQGIRPASRTRGHVLAPPLTGCCVRGGSPASTEFRVGCTGLWRADGETWCVAHKDGS